jgi:hypothetical protein
MSLSVDYCYQFALKLIKKNQAGGLASKDFEYQWNDAQGSYQDDLLGRFQARSNGKTGINTGLIEDETILQKLAPFTKPVNLTIASGNADKPIDFVYRLALRVNGVDAYKINPGQIANVNASAIDTPSTTTDTYYFVEYEDYYYFLPRTLPTVSITTAQLDYIKTPENVIWGYTFDANGRQVYNPGTSVQPSWDNNSCREITKRMLTNLGVAFKDNDFANFGKSVQMTGE